MKNIFLTLFLFISTFVLSAQSSIQQWQKVTSQSSTSTMIWSTVDKEYMFFSNDDLQQHWASWNIVFNFETNKGFIKSGDNIIYTVSRFELKEEGGDKGMVIADAYHETLNTPVTFVMGTVNNKFVITVFAPLLGNAYYFYE